MRCSKDHGEGESVVRCSKDHDEGESVVRCRGFVVRCSKDCGEVRRAIYYACPVASHVKRLG